MRFSAADGCRRLLKGARRLVPAASVRASWGDPVDALRWRGNRAITAAFTGMQTNFKDTGPELIYTQGTDQLQQYGRFHISTSECRLVILPAGGTFLRGHRKGCGEDDPCRPGREPGHSVCTEDDAGLDTKLTEAGAITRLNRYPTFSEIFRIRPLQAKRYQVTLVPTSLQPASTYSETTVPGRKPAERPVCLPPEK